MKDISFEFAFNRLVSFEGGYVNNPKDHGGETMWGISKRSYPNEDIKNMSRRRAAFIYKRDFWLVLEGVYPSVRYQAFDFAVNSGIDTAIKKLQKAIGVVDDGKWGPNSAKAALRMNENDMLILYIAERLEFWASLQTWASFGKGWARRAAGNMRYAAQDNPE